MKRHIRFRRTPREDIIDIADYLAGNAPPSVGVRFSRAVNQTLKSVAAQPGIGKPRNFGPQLPGLRSTSVAGFAKYLIFYCTTDDAIDVVRIVYGGRDLDALFRDDPDPI
ncbi:MAG: type II toxin-antitoxin system RelE/ParE family toxin [Gemmataceae bacterium]